MNIRGREARGEAPDRQRAWDLLATVEDHPKVKAWLDEAVGPAFSAGRRERKRLIRRWAAAAALVLAIGLGAGGYLLHSSGQRYQTRVGEQRDVVLPDGSKVTMNTDTMLRVHYSGERRYLVLERGEALFAVKRDPARPFDVVAGDTLTRALGTEFNVDMRTTKVTVSVLEGAVHVVAANGAGNVSAGIPRSRALEKAGLKPIAALAKGQALEFDREGGHTLEEKADLKRIDAWRTRRLEFSDTPLLEAVEEFNRYSTTRVVVGTTELSPVRVTGVFRIGDAQGFLFSLREVLHVETHESDDEIVLLRPAP